MAQFEVYNNSNTGTRQKYPFLIDVQHAVLSTLASRLVVPLRDAETVDRIAMDILLPTIRFSEKEYVLMTTQLSSMPVRLLRDPIGTLEHSRSEILAAIDFAITGF